MRQPRMSIDQIKSNQISIRDYLDRVRPLMRSDLPTTWIAFYPLMRLDLPGLAPVTSSHLPFPLSSPLPPSARSSHPSPSPSSYPACGSRPERRHLLLDLFLLRLLLGLLGHVTLLLLPSPLRSATLSTARVSSSFTSSSVLSTYAWYSTDPRTSLLHLDQLHLHPWADLLELDPRGGVGFGQAVVILRELHPRVDRISPSESENSDTWPLLAPDSKNSPMSVNRPKSGTLFLVRSFLRCLLVPVGNALME